MKYPDFKQLTIKEIKAYTKGLEVDAALVEIADLLAEDKRKGVQRIAKKLKNKLAKKEAVIAKWMNMNSLQEKLEANGYQAVIGIDEAGRGPLAGPVVAAAVLLDTKTPIYGLDDSKKIKREKRERLLQEIKAKAKVGIGQASSREIDKYNIREATFAAMKRAVKNLLPQLEEKPDLLLIDGNTVIPDLKIDQKAVIDGDAKINSIAAASIAAKVSRDQIIFDYADQYPEYNFKSNKGYGTAEHIAALEEYGSSPIHRKSFARVPE